MQDIRNTQKSSVEISFIRQMCHQLVGLTGVGMFGVIVALPLTGCQGDSWFDPSVVGRWETTPAVAPILERLDVIEPADDPYFEVTQVTSGDLIPDVKPYQLGPSDALLIEIFELFDSGVPYMTQRVVDDTGYISLPIVGQMYVAGSSEMELQQMIVDRLTPDFLRDPQVSVVAQNKTQNTYIVMGSAGAGRYAIPESRFLLTEAIAAAGGLSPTVESIHVVRQIPLDDVVITGWGEPGRHETTGNAEIPVEPVYQDTPADMQINLKEPDEDLDSLIDELLSPDAGGGMTEANTTAQITTDPKPQNNNVDEPPLQVPVPVEGNDHTQSTKWLYLDGEWVRVQTSSHDATHSDSQTDENGIITQSDAAQLVTQRVIEIPAKPLMDGVARYNIIIRPDDLIMIPTPEVGLVYLTGDILRPGVFNLPSTGRLTLTRAIAGAGGLNALGIPERVDIIRMIGKNRQATIRVNLRAIMEMTEPDIYLKPDDMINVGTAWYAAPLAVMRNGFRTTYGFGFLLDRNFGNDVFGPPPVDRTN